MGKNTSGTVVRIVLIGAGNLATQTGLALKQSGAEVCAVYSRTQESAAALAARLECGFTTSLAALPTEADLYLFAVKDAVLEEVIGGMPHTRGIWAHTAGSVPMQLPVWENRPHGVFYPLQTFTKGRDVDFSAIPIYIEGVTPDVTEQLKQVAALLTRRVREASSDQRRKLHLAAVFACNFANHCYTLAASLLEREGMEFSDLAPLIAETAAKVEQFHPRDAQTGPAVRNDREVMARHLAQLPDDRMRRVYEVMSESIVREFIIKNS